jgi:hypothetical protein
MTESKRFNVAARLVVIALSSVTMLWLLWRFPIPTSIACIVSLGILLHCVQFARWVDLAVACGTETYEFSGPPLPAAGGVSNNYRRTPIPPPITALVRNDIRKTRQNGGI